MPLKTFICFCLIFPIIGVEHVSGDMFIEVPKGDALFMTVTIYMNIKLDIFEF